MFLLWHLPVDTFFVYAFFFYVEWQSSYFSPLEAVKKNHFQNFKSTKTKQIIFSAHFSHNVKVILIVKGNFQKDALV